MTKQPQPFSKIESPLISFNNILLQLSKDIYKIYFGNAHSQSELNQLSNIYKCPTDKLFKLLSQFNNQLIFQNNSLTIFLFIKFEYINGEVVVSFNGKLNDFQLTLVENTIDNKKQIEAIFNQYLYYIGSFNKNMDLTVNENFIKDVYDGLVDGKNLFQKILIPHKEKLAMVIDNCSLKDNEEFIDYFNRCSYVIDFNKANSKLEYRIYKQVSTKLSDAKTVENMRYESCDIIYNGSISNKSLKEFLLKLFYYGEIIN